MQWLFVKGQFDPAREVTEKTFMRKVVTNRLLNILEEIKAKKRQVHLKSISLEEAIMVEPGTKFEECLGVDGDALELSAKVDLNAGLSKAFTQLSARQKRLCRLLGDEGLSMSEASRRLKIPRTTLQLEAIRIREVFRKEGLGEHLR